MTGFKIARQDGFIKKTNWENCNFLWVASSFIQGLFKLRVCETKVNDIDTSTVQYQVIYFSES